jgi:hypothetical protein
MILQFVEFAELLTLKSVRIIQPKVHLNCMIESFLMICFAFV